MAIWSSLLMASCCFAAQAGPPASELGESRDQDVVQRPKMVSFIAHRVTVAPSWRESFGEGRFREIDRQGDIAVWSADPETVQELARFAQRDLFGEFMGLPALIAPENVAAETAQTSAAPLYLTIAKEASPGNRDITTSKTGTADLRLRLRLAAERNESPLSSTASRRETWTIDGALERDAVGQTLQTIDAQEGRITIATPRVIRHRIANRWPLEADRVLVVRLGQWTPSPLAGPRPGGRNDSLTSSRTYDCLIVIQPKANASPSATPAPAPIASRMPEAIRDPNVLRAFGSASPRDERSSNVRIRVNASADPKMVTRLYYVGDLVDVQMLSALARTIAEKVAPGSWNDVDDLDAQAKAKDRDPAKGTIIPFCLNSSVIVRALPDAHEKIERKLDFWRLARRNDLSAEALFGPGQNH